MTQLKNQPDILQEPELRLFDVEASAAETFQPVANIVDDRHKHLAKAAIWLLKSKGKQHAVFFMEIDPDDPPAQDEIDLEFQRMASGAVQAASKVREERVKKAKKEFATASSLQEGVKLPYISQAESQRTLERMWQDFDRAFDMHFTDLAESKGEMSEKEAEIKKRLPTILKIRAVKYAGMTDQPNFEIPKDVQEQLAAEPAAPDTSYDKELEEISRRAERNTASSTADAVRRRLSDAEIRNAARREQEQDADISDD